MDGKLALDTVKSFKEIMSPEDYDAFVKGEDSAKLRAFPEVQEFLKAEKEEEPPEPPEPPEEDEEDEERPPKKSKKYREEEEDVDEEENEEEEKAFSISLAKGIADEINARLEDELGELKKSVDSIKDLVEKVAGMPIGTKAIKAGATAQFLEKALGGNFQEDESGKKVLSVTRDKEAVLKALDNGLSKATDNELKKSYENSIMRYNAGGGSIDQEVALDLFEKHDIRLVK